LQNYFSFDRKRSNPQKMSSTQVGLQILENLEDLVIDSCSFKK